MLRSEQGALLVLEGERRPHAFVLGQLAAKQGVQAWVRPSLREPKIHVDLHRLPAAAAAIDEVPDNRLGEAVRLQRTGRC